MHLIDFTKIRSNIYARDENVYNNVGWDKSGKHICMVSPYSLGLKDENKLNNYISLFNHLVESLRIMYGIKIIVEKKHKEISLKNLKIEKEEVFILDSDTKIIHGNLNPRQLLFSKTGDNVVKFECSVANNFINKSQVKIRKNLPDPDKPSIFYALPRNLSFNEFCICDNFILISKALEDKYPSIKEELSKFFNFENVVAFSAPNNETDISRYFRSLDSVAPINYGKEEYIVSDNPQLIYSHFNDQNIDTRIEKCLEEIENMTESNGLSLDKIKFNNFIDTTKPNALDFSIMDSTFVLPLYNAEYHANYNSLADMYPDNIFLSITHPNLGSAHDIGLFFSNLMSISIIK